MTTGIQVHLGIGSEGGGHMPPSLAGRSPELLIRPWAGLGSAGCGAPAKPCLHTLPSVQAEPSGHPYPQASPAPLTSLSGPSLRGVTGFFHTSLPVTVCHSLWSSNHPPLASGMLPGLGPLHSNI